MNAGWIALGVAIAGAAIGLVASWHRRNQMADFGNVSTHWIAEQRAGQRQDNEH
jgi:hypothetical protein